MDSKPRIGGIIVSHGQVANELLSAAETVVGELSCLAAVSIGWHDDVESSKAEIETAIKKVSQGLGVVLMTDMFGGTPTNISAMFYKEGEVEIVTGVNLPMVIRLATTNREMTLDEMAGDIAEQGRSAITRAGKLLAPATARKDG